MDDGVVIEHDGRVVGVAVRVRGGYMFFSSDPDLKLLEATVFRRPAMITKRVAESFHAKITSEPCAMRSPRRWSGSAIDPAGTNVVRLHPRKWSPKGDSEPPDAA